MSLMLSIQIKNEQGLALMGSLLLVSMLAVMSTSFLLIMAADVRIAQSHLASTQAYYMAESAAEIAAYQISNNPSLALNAAPGDTILSGIIDEGEFYVFSHPSVPAVDYKRELRIRAISDRAWYDLYIDIVVPSQDPRTYYPIVSWNNLDLRRNCQVIGGEGVWSSNSVTVIGVEPYVESTFFFDSPSSGNGMFYVSGSADWVTGGIAPELADSFDLYTNYPAMYTANPPETVDPYYPQLLDSENSPYPYYITGNPQEYRATVIPTRNVSGALPAVDAGTNPMYIYVWDFDGGDGEWSDDFTIDGTLVCPGTAKIKFQYGDVTITPRFTGTSPDEYYPAIVATGEIELRESGTRIFNGLVYSETGFDSDPRDGGSLVVSGAVIARDIELKRNTTISYNSILQTNPAAAFMPKVDLKYPTYNLHRRRYIDTPPVPP